MGEKSGKKKRIGMILLGAVCFTVVLPLFLMPKREIVPEYVFTYAENQTSDYPTTMGGKYFAELVEERTQGRIRIQVCAEGMLGSESEVISQMRYGGIDFARISLAQVADYVPRMKVLQLPYIYEDASHMWRALDGEIGERFLNYTREYDLVGLSWYDAGTRNIYSVARPVETFKDMEELHIRVQESEMMSEIMVALGAVPVQIPYDQVYEALERGKVDAAENNWPSYEAMQHYEVAPFYTVDEHMRIPEMQICSIHTWTQLSEEDQKIILECAKESAFYERELWKSHEKKAREKALDNHVTEIVLSEEEKRSFKKAVRLVYEKYYENYGADIEEILSLKEVGK